MNIYTENFVADFPKADYLIVIQLNNDLKDKIQIIKNDFIQKFKYTQAQTAQHIHLASFSQFIHLEKRITHKLETLGKATKPFTIELEGFESLPAHSIYFNTTTGSILEKLVKMLRTEAQQFMKIDADNKPFFNIKPQILLAHKLKPWQYEQAWHLYEQHNFSGKFIAYEMILLKKKENTKNFQFQARFPFEAHALKPLQMSLF